MGIDQVNGIPAHALLVHATVVLVPLACALTIGSALWPALRNRLGIITPLMAFVAMVMVPVTTEAGEWLARRMRNTPLIEKHVEIADNLLPWVVGVFAVAVVQWGYYRFGLPASVGRGSRKPTQNVPAMVLLALLAVVTAAGSVVEIYRIGDSGAKAVWTGNFSDKPVQNPALQ